MRPSGVTARIVRVFCKGAACSDVRCTGLQNGSQVSRFGETLDKLALFGIISMIHLKWREQMKIKIKDVFEKDEKDIHIQTNERLDIDEIFEDVRE